MIGVAVLDPHPATRAGLERLVAETPGLVGAGAAGDPRALWPLLYRADPDVLLLGADRPAEALRLCLRVRGRQFRARVVVYAPHTGFDTMVPATFAGAHAVVDKAAGLAELLAAVRAPAPRLPALTPLMQRRAAARLEPLDRAILAMTLAGTPAREIARVVGLGSVALAARRARLLAVLCGSEVTGALDGARELHA
jgi:DNA-binding NarL/FixJ family response regulator